MVLSHEFSLCLCDGVPSVVNRVAFFVGAIVGDALNDDLRIIPAGQGSFRVSPVCFRLAAVTGGHPARAAERFREIFRRLRRIFLHVEILSVIEGVGLVVDAHDEGFIVFSVRESGQTEEPGNIRGCRIAAILRGEGTQQRFRLSCVEAFDAPDHLMFSGRSVENEVRWWHVAGSTDCLKRSAGFLVEVEIRVANFADLFFGAVSRPFSYRIHSDENVASRLVLLMQLGLKGDTRDCFSRKNSLSRLVPSAIPDQHRDLVPRLVEGIHVFRRGQESRRE